MRIAVLGAGFTGLTAAYDLLQAGHEVVIFEKEPFVGGLAAGFRDPSWDWHLERAYHHLFTNDDDILSFAREIGFDGMRRYQPETSSLYRLDGALQTVKLDSPTDLLRLSLLSFVERIRAGIVLAFFKLSPFLPIFEKHAAADFLTATMGKNGWNVLFAPLFRKKFGKYAEKILTSFIWARIKKRSKDLVYVENGFQSLLDHLLGKIEDAGGTVRLGTAVGQIRKNNGKFTVKIIQEGDQKGRKEKITHQDGPDEIFDQVICSLPTPLIPRIAADLLPPEYCGKLAGIEYLGALNLIVATDRPVLDQTYWLSVCVEEFPMMVLVQHTNLVGAGQYGGAHLLYVGNYLSRDDQLMKADDEAVLNAMLPALEELSPGVSETIQKRWVFRAPFAQPIFDAGFLDRLPTFETPVDGFWIANLDMTYPYDRGTNFAVRLGRQVAARVVQ